MLLKTLHSDMLHKAEWYGLPPNRASLLRMCFSDGSFALLLYRLMRFFQQSPLKPLAFIIYRLNAFLSGVVIGRNAEFGPGLIFLHSIGIIVNSEVRAGKNLVLEHGVTIGAEKGKSPVLGDNVFVGAGAKIIGAVHIGSDVKIGANAVVVTDLPDGATAVGIPAKVVRIYGEKPETPNLKISCVEATQSFAPKQAKVRERRNRMPHFRQRRRMNSTPYVRTHHLQRKPITLPSLALQEQYD